MGYEEAEQWLLRGNSYQILEMVMEIKPYMKRADWLKLLGYAWPLADNISEYLPKLHRAIGKKRPCKPMMDVQELAMWKSLPDVVTVFRGCGIHNLSGASWTLDKETAENFPFLNRYRTEEPLLVTGQAKKDEIVAVKIDREEYEIICFAVHRTKLEKLTYDPERERRRIEKSQAW